jgi:hypothetical protein
MTSWPLLPIAARVQVSGWPAIWLPVIVLWPLFIALFCLALPTCVLVPAPRRAMFATLVASYQVLCSLHGTKVEIEEPATGTWNIALY